MCAAGSLASLAYGKACGATIRRDLIDVAACTARHGHGHITLHLPEAWHREHEWMTLFTATCGPPRTGLTSPDLVTAPASPTQPTDSATRPRITDRPQEQQATRQPRPCSRR